MTTNPSLIKAAIEKIKENGFLHYEISNFGTYQSKHNKGYWELEDYIGAGAGAVGFLKDTRYYPQTHIESYINNPLKITEEALSEDELLTENIFLGLRSCIGVQKSLLSKNMIAKADNLCTEKKLLCKDSHYYNENFFLSDELALYILD